MRYQTHIAQESRGRISEKLIRSFSIGVRSIGRDDATRVSRMLAAAIELTFLRVVVSVKKGACPTDLAFLDQASVRVEMAASKRSVRARHREDEAATRRVRLIEFQK